jgi:integrase
MSRGQGLGRLRRELVNGRYVYRGDWTDASGNRVRRILGADKDTAQRLLAEAVRTRDRIKAGLASELGQDALLTTLAAEYLGELATRTTSKHVETVRHQLEILPGILHARQVRDLRPEHYERYRQRMLKAKAANATVNTSLAALGGMLNWAVATRRIAENPLASLKALPTGRAHQKRPKRALTETEAEAFLRAAYAADEVAARRRAAILTISGMTQGKSYAARSRPDRIPQGPLLRFLLETGVRWNEARQVRWADLDVVACRLTLRPATTKNRKGRTLPIKPSLASELGGLPELYHRALGRAPRREDPVFLTARGKPWPQDTCRIRRILEPIWKAAGIERVNEEAERVDVHSLRHTCATRLARAAVPMAMLQKFLGHQDPRTSQRYYDHLQVEDLEDALKLVPETIAAAQSRV